MTETKGQRPQAEIDLLTSAFGIATSLVDNAHGDPTKETPLASFTDAEVMAFAYVLLTGDLASLMTPPEWKPDEPGVPQVCGWCVHAAGDDTAARNAAETFATVAAVREHTKTCPNNPLVVEVERLTRLLEAAEAKLVEITGEAP